SPSPVAPTYQSKRRPALMVARLMVQRSWPKMPVSAWMFSRASDPMRSVTEVDTPLLNVSAEMSPVHCCKVRRRPCVTAAPNFIACEPVTYETDADSVNSFEKWSAGLFHAFVVKPVAESTNV